MDARLRYSLGVIEVVRRSSETLRGAEKLKGGGADDDEASVMMIVATAIKACFDWVVNEFSPQYQRD